MAKRKTSTQEPPSDLQEPVVTLAPVQDTPSEPEAPLTEPAPTETPEHPVEKTAGVPYPKCYEMVATNYQLVLPSGRVVVLNQGFTNVLDPDISEAIFTHPTSQLMISCGMMYTYPITKSGAANTLGLEVADGRMADEAPISDLHNVDRSIVKANHRLGENIEEVKTRVANISAETKGTDIVTNLVVG